MALEFFLQQLSESLYTTSANAIICTCCNLTFGIFKSKVKTEEGGQKKHLQGKWFVEISRLALLFWRCDLNILLACLKVARHLNFHKNTYEYQF